MSKSLDNRLSALEAQQGIIGSYSTMPTFEIDVDPSWGYDEVQAALAAKYPGQYPPPGRCVVIELPMEEGAL